MKRSEIFFSLIKIPIDFGMAMLAFALAYNLRLRPDFWFIQEADPSQFLSFHAYLQQAFSGALLLLIIFAFFKMYVMRVTASLPREIRTIFLATFVWLMAVITYFFAIREFPFSRLVLGYTAVFIVALASFGRFIIKALQRMCLHWGIGRRRVLFVGLNNVAFEIAEALRRGGHYDIVGAVGMAWSGDDSKKRLVPLLGGVKELSEIAKRRRIDQIIQTKEDLSTAQATTVIELCRELHIEYLFVPDLLDMYRTNVAVNSIAGIPIISLRGTPLDGWGKVWKRAFDFIISAGALIILSPVFLALAIAIKLDSPGTVFFKYLDDGREANRVGDKGALFHCWKFRTMKANTHSLRYSKELQSKNTRQGSPLTKIKEDPRVTRVGRFLRMYSLDELPQLWNVLRGDMSLVGPRPHLPEEVEHYKKHHKFVLAIKPGITGLAQISGRSDIDFEEEVRLDTYYIENWSPWLDIKIIFKTPAVVVRGHRE